MQTDWGGEYEKLNSFFQKIGISHKVSCHHAHQQNGAAERKHRHIVEVGLALLANSSMPLKFGMKLSSQQLISLIFFLVRSLIIKLLLRSYSLRSLTIIPYASLAVLCGLILDLTTLGSLLFGLLDVFFGYSSTHKGYKCLEPSTGRVYTSRDVVFDESIFPFSELYPNARALLQKEVLLWPHTTRIQRFP